MRCLIVGAGVTGLMAAVRLVEDEGTEVIVAEASDAVGGAHQDFRVGDYSFDMGPFYFSERAPFFTTFDVSKDLFVAIQHRPFRVLAPGRFEAYPFSRSELRRTATDPRAVFDLLMARVAGPKGDNAAAWSRRRLGNRFYETSGIGNYISQFNRVAAEQVDTVFCERRMKVVGEFANLGKLMKAPMALLKPPHSGGRRYTRGYGGYRPIYDSILGSAAASRFSVRLGETGLRLRSNGAGFIADMNAGSEHFDRVMWSAPIDLAERAVFGESSVGDAYLDLHSLFFSLDGAFAIDAADVIYNFTKDGDWKRLTLFSKYFGRKNDREYFTVEITAHDKKPADIKQLADNFVRYCSAHKLVNGTMRLEGHHTNAYGYPLYVSDKIARVKRAIQRLGAAGIELVGRQGQFDYIGTSAAARTQLMDYLNTGKWRPLP